MQKRKRINDAWENQKNLKKKPCIKNDHTVAQNLQFDWKNNKKHKFTSPTKSKISPVKQNVTPDSSGFEEIDKSDALINGQRTKKKAKPGTTLLQLAKSKVVKYDDIPTVNPTQLNKKVKRVIPQKNIDQLTSMFKNIAQGNDLPSLSITKFEETPSLSTSSTKVQEKSSTKVLEKRSTKIQEKSSTKSSYSHFSNIKQSLQGNAKEHLENYSRPAGSYFSQNFKGHNPQGNKQYSHSSNIQQSLQGNAKKEHLENYSKPVDRYSSQSFKEHNPQSDKTVHPTISPSFNEREDPEKLKRTLFVGNLPLDVNHHILKKIFSPFGDVESARIRCVIPTKLCIPKKVANITQKYHKCLKSLKGYVVFKTEQGAKSGLELNGCVVKNRHLRVDFAVNSDKFNERLSVFVGNLSFEVDDESLWEAFSKCGEIGSVRVIRDPGTGVGKGFGFIQFMNEESVKKALLMNDEIVENRNIRVKVACQEKKMQNGPPNSHQQHHRQRHHKQNDEEHPKIKWQLKGWALKQKKLKSSPHFGKSTKKIMKRKNLELEKKKMISILSGVGKKKERKL